jgi:pyrroloquinoline quinone (PQQ) biosynthesis protein C
MNFFISFSLFYVKIDQEMLVMNFINLIAHSCKKHHYTQHTLTRNFKICEIHSTRQFKIWVILPYAYKKHIFKLKSHFGKLIASSCSKLQIESSREG